MKPYILRDGGKSAVILTIPASILAESGLKIGDAVSVESPSLGNISVKRFGVK